MKDKGELLIFVFQAEFDAKHEWNTIKGESIIKGDYKTEDGSRILLFSINACLRYLAKAKGLCVDGTFSL